MASEPHRRVLLAGAGRGLGGAVLFAMPIFMTQEVWHLGLTIPRHRLALLVAATLVLVGLLVRFFGTTSAPGNRYGVLADTGIAVAVAAVAAGLVLSALSVLRPLSDWREAASVIGIELLPADVGASFARSQLSSGSRRAEVSGYRHEILLMVAGAAVFSANIAPTEEIAVLAARAGPWHAIALVLVSLLLMHFFVYTVGFKGQEAPRGGPVQTFVLFTVVGYVASLLVAAYLLWTFGRFDGTGAGTVVVESVVLALPGSLGAAAARLIL